MSLSVDGVWKAGVWATTVWADGVWFEGTPTPAVQQNSGGWLHVPTGKRKTKAELRAEREEWGILPKKAKALIKRVAAQQIEEPDTAEADTQVLVAAFDRAELAYKQQYAELLRREIGRLEAQMREDEEILLLLH